MNAPFIVPTRSPSLVEILSMLARSAASSYEVHPLDMADVIDPLQYFAEATGLVDAIGNDRVQSLLAEPFARVRRRDP
jgi:hypothetical protein